MNLIQKFKNCIITKINRALRLIVYPYMADKGISYDWRTKDYLELYGKSDYANPVIHGVVKEVAMAVAHTESGMFQVSKQI